MPSWQDAPLADEAPDTRPPGARGGLPPDQKYNSKGQPISPSLATMSPQERANNDASMAAIKSGKSAWGEPSSEIPKGREGAPKIGETAPGGGTYAGVVSGQARRLPPGADALYQRVRKAEGTARIGPRPQAAGASTIARLPRNKAAAAPPSSG